LVIKIDLKIILYIYNKKDMDEFGVINFTDIDIENDTTETTFNEVYNDNLDILKNYNTLKVNNKTRPIMTKYEKTKVLGLRAQMLASGAKPLVEFPNYITNVIDIAELELKERKIPFILRRKMKNSYEYWKIEDLIIR
jgi:DNA-directed RNA polymerase subunit K/omega